MYTEKDLENERTLNRALDLVHHKRQGQSEVSRVLSVHINYNALSDAMRQGACEETDIVLRREGEVRLRCNPREIV